MDYGTFIGGAALGIIFGISLGILITTKLILNQKDNDTDFVDNDRVDLDSLLTKNETIGQKNQQPRDWGKVCERWTKREKEGMI